VTLMYMMQGIAIALMVKFQIINDLGECLNDYEAFILDCVSFL
jgi:hypothetical protein